MLATGCTLLCALCVGCAGTGLTLDHPAIQSVLALCNDVPLEQYDNCMADALTRQPDAGAITVADILELLAAPEVPE